MPEFIFFGDIVNRETGKTFRQENLEKNHQYPIGALVEISYPTDDEAYSEDVGRNGIRLHIISQNRDCDGTPLYSLGVMGGDHEGDLALVKPLTYPLELLEMFNGYSEENLILIKEPSQ
jgi:hypothetical protein